MKWVGHNDSKNEWIPCEKMSCDLLKLAFETKQWHHIFGVRNQNGLDYATFGRQLYMVPSDYAQELWIHAVIEFLEGRIVFQMPDIQNADTPQIEIEENVVGLPDDIIGKTNSFLSFFYRFTALIFIAMMSS